MCKLYVKKCTFFFTSNPIMQVFCLHTTTWMKQIKSGLSRGEIFAATRACYLILISVCLIYLLTNLWSFINRWYLKWEIIRSANWNKLQTLDVSNIMPNKKIYTCRQLGILELNSLPFQPETRDCKMRNKFVEFQFMDT